MDIREKYQKEVVPKLGEEFGYRNPLACPRLLKIVINTSQKEALEDKKVSENFSEVMAAISGQKPAITRAKKAIAGFHLQRGDPIGLKVTLRGRRRDDFFQKLVTAVLPRIRDFRGVDPASFDGRGNYTLGIREQLVFPEVDYGKIDKIRGLEVTIVTSAKNDEEGKRLLELLGMPFVPPQAGLGVNPNK